MKLYLVTKGIYEDKWPVNIYLSKEDADKRAERLSYDTDEPTSVQTIVLRGDQRILDGLVKLKATYKVGDAE